MNIVSIYPHPMDDQYRHDHNVTMIKDKEIYSYEEAKLKGSKNDDASTKKNLISSSEKML